ncbi:MAG: rRNA adenine N-6-methyltransferase family protein, partial [Patescibacteria group bacterium]
MLHQIRAKKSLGQHFLICPWVISAMIEAAPLSPLDTVLEIGPGTGVLTRPLA